MEPCLLDDGGGGGCSAEPRPCCSEGPGEGCTGTSWKEVWWCGRAFAGSVGDMDSPNWCCEDEACFEEREGEDFSNASADRADARRVAMSMGGTGPDIPCVLSLLRWSLA
jgi:hypothetical protein